MKLFYIFGLLFFLTLFSCEKEEGEGGQATLKGTLIVQETFSSPVLGIKDSVVKTYPAVNERVYITYGNNDIYDDDFRTDFNGAFKFENLRTGDYTLYAYQDCNTCDEGISVISTSIEISDKKGTTTVAPIILTIDISQ